MDISAEKAEIMRRFEEVNDVSLIRAIKSILDFGLSRQNREDDLNSSIDRAIADAENGMLRPHEEVMKELRERPIKSFQL